MRLNAVLEVINGRFFASRLAKRLRRIPKSKRWLLLPTRNSFSVFACVLVLDLVFLEAEAMLLSLIYQLLKVGT